MCMKTKFICQEIVCHITTTLGRAMIVVLIFSSNELFTHMNLKKQALFPLTRLKFVDV